MGVRQSLPERADVFVFEHKESQVNYGGDVQFHQAAFPLAEGETRGFEEVVYFAVRRFTEILQEPVSREPVRVIADAELADIYFDQWRETPRLSANAFQEWTQHELHAVASAYRRLRVNAIQQELETGIVRLDYFVSLAAVTLSTEIIAEYFEKTMEQLGNLATAARLTLGRCLALQLQRVENEAALLQMQQAKLRRPETDPGCRRLLNPLILGFADAADLGLVEEIQHGPNPFHLSAQFTHQLTTLVKSVLEKSRRLQAANLRRALAEPAALQAVLQSRPDFRRLVREFRRRSDLRTQLIYENTLVSLRRVLRELAAKEPDGEVLGFVANERQMGELLTKGAQRRRLLRHLKARHGSWADKIRDTLEDGMFLVRRARRRWWGRLSGKELAQEVTAGLNRLAQFLSQVEDFRLLRSHYGRDTNRAASWQGLKLWRIYEMVHQDTADANRHTLILVDNWPRCHDEVLNAFAEGNLFLCRSTGEIYPLSQQRRGLTMFLFADLRNSTETTMKLTKDTASYLAPYLTAVDSCAEASGGQRIYFAGDGYAAYFLGARDAIRGAYRLSAQFSRLRALSSEERRRRAREIYMRAKETRLDLKRPAVLRKGFMALDARLLAPEVKDLLIRLGAQKENVLSQETLTRVLARVAEIYSMPRVDAGVAITSGELFFAMVGEEGKAKTPIVISPALTQAARLSGSSDAVKNYIEEKLPHPFPFAVHAWEQKLYNRGIVVTEDLVEEVLRQEAEVLPLTVREKPFEREKLIYFADPDLKRRILLRYVDEPVFLKGIDLPTHVYEVILPGSALDKLHGALPAESP